MPEPGSAAAYPQQAAPITQIAKPSMNFRNMPQDRRKGR
jgi:hypothetical protein